MYCGSNESSDVKNKVWDIPEVSILLNGIYTVLYKADPRSYWMQKFTFCEGLGRPVRNMK